MVARPARQCILQRVLWPVALRAIVGHNYVFQVVIRNNLLGQGSCVFRPEGYSIVQVYIKVFLLMSLPVMGRPMQLQSLSFLVKALHRNWSRFFYRFTIHQNDEMSIIPFLFFFSSLFLFFSQPYLLGEYGGFHTRYHCLCSVASLVRRGTGMGLTGPRWLLSHRYLRG